MYTNKKQFRKQPVRNVPKHLVLAAIAESKKTVTGRIPIVESEKQTRAFSDFPLDPRLQENIRAMGYIQATPVQEQVIPAIIEGRDVIGTSHTGTGKTAAFLIPLVQKITVDRAQRVLVIAPTRELAYQTYTQLQNISRGLSVRTAILIGGTNEWRQKQDIQRDPHVVIATPGRLKDFIETRVIRLSGFRNVVLDEADRMVDIGFISVIQYFITLLPTARQSLFFSATISGKVEAVMHNFVQNPVRVRIDSQEAPNTITQDVIQVTGTMSKVDTLHALLLKKEFDKVLVFGRTKHGVQRISDELNKRGIRSAAIHGNKRQSQRMHALSQFAKNEIQILLATDVASRGLDIPDVSHVINYDLPETMEDYVHRIGRTGRANKRGIALTFID